MILEPTTQKEALANAILAAAEAHRTATGHASASTRWAAVADAWSRIACQLPAVQKKSPSIVTGNAAAEVQPILSEDEVETILALRNGTLRVVLHEDDHPEIDLAPVAREAGMPIQVMVSADEYETLLADRRERADNDDENKIRDLLGVKGEYDIIEVGMGKPVPPRARRALRAALAMALDDEETYGGSMKLTSVQMGKYARKRMAITFYDGGARIVLDGS